MEEKQYYKEKRISNSSLKYFEQSPLTFKRFLDSELDQEEKQYFVRGKQIHMAILEPDEFKKNYTHLDFETPKSEQQKQFCDDYLKYLSLDKDEDTALLNAYRDNYKLVKKDDIQLNDARILKGKLSKYIDYLNKRKQYKEVLSYSDWNKIQDLKEQIAKHKKANELLSSDELDTRQIHNELVIFWEDPLYKLPCKSMLDRLIIDHEKKKIILIDLKTANAFKEFKERCREFSYFRQLAFYWYAVNWYFINALNKDIAEYEKETYIITLKTVDDPEVKVYNISEGYLLEGWDELAVLLKEVEWHWTNDKWEYSRSYYLGDGDEKL